MADQIFKVQVPIASSDPVPCAMFYNEDRSEQYMTPLDDSTKEFMGDDLKKFCFGRYDEKTDMFHISKEAPWQTW